MSLLLSCKQDSSVQSFTKTLIEMNCLSYDLWQIHRCYYTTSVVYEYGADAFFREKVTGKSYFLQ